MNDPIEDETTQSKTRLSLLQMMGSVVQAAFGVSAKRVRERDFQRGSPVTFAILGIIGTVLFVLSVFTVVKLVLRSAGV